jgi:hypothetical protein
MTGDPQFLRQSLIFFTARPITTENEVKIFANLQGPLARTQCVIDPFFWIQPTNLQNYHSPDRDPVPLPEILGLAMGTTGVDRVVDNTSGSQKEGLNERRWRTLATNRQAPTCVIQLAS